MPAYLAGGHCHPVENRYVHPADFCLQQSADCFRLGRTRTLFSRLRFTSKAVNHIASTVVATLFVQHIFFMVHPVIAFFVEYQRRKLANLIIDLFIIKQR